MEQLTPLLERLAEKLGTTVDHLWLVTVNQAHVYVISWLLYLAIAVLSFGGLVYMARLYEKFSENIMGDDWRSTCTMIGAIVFGILAIGITIHHMVTFEDFITAIYNPEYWALKEILNQLTK